MTITNTGSTGSKLIVGTPTITATGANIGQFTVTGNNCPAGGLAHNATGAQPTCTITAHFRATTTGAKTASLNIPSNATATATVLNMTGNGTPSLLGL